MKEKLSAFVLAALLVLALSGCTEKQKNGDTNQTTKGTNSETYNYTYPTDPQGRTGSSDGTQTPSMSAGDYAQRNASQRSWEQMLSDGRVDD